MTTFSPKGYERYGKRFLETYVKHWPIPIDVWYEDKPDFEHEKITYRDINSIENRKKFIARAKEIPGADGIIDGEYNFHFDSIKFCNKVFCQIETEGEYVFWLDADIVTYSDVPEGMLRLLLEGVPFCFFGRASYTETGFIGFRKTHHMYALFKRQYLRAYMEGILYTLPGWHDCYAFDYARIGIEGNNLSPNGKGLEHVMAKSFLAKYMDHLKGARKKHGHSPESCVRWW